MQDVKVNAHGNSNDEQIIVSYAMRESYQSLFHHMLEAIAGNCCTAKADAHIALCVKFAIHNGCDEALAFNCYESEDADGNFSDFHLFRDHTRALTDFLDEQLNWDLSLPISDSLSAKGVERFLRLAKQYKFKALTANRADAAVSNVVKL